MNDELKLKKLLGDAIGEAPKAKPDELQDIQKRMEEKSVLEFPRTSQKKSFAVPIALAATLMAVTLFFAFRTEESSAPENEALAEFVYESLATPHEEYIDRSLYEPWIDVGTP